MEIIRAENFSFSYPGSENCVLKDISFSIKNGDFITICGRSGSGKSTLLRNLKPMIAPKGTKRGSIFFEGNIVWDRDEIEQSTKIGYVSQNPENQVVTDKVWHELVFGLESLGYNSNEIRSKAAEMASFFGIQNWFYKNVCELSGGQKQILNLASVLIMNPSVLILDEPTSQLDPIAAQDFLMMLKRINTELGITVIAAEHHLEDIYSISDRVFFMENGRIVFDAAPDSAGGLLKGNDFFDALPLPVRIHTEVENDYKCPITVKDAREWLKKISIDKRIEDYKILDCEKVKKEAVIELKNVWYRYAKDLPDALCGLSLKVNKSEILAVLGGNGAGKTTALSVICGILKPSRGAVIVRDKNYSSIGMLVQNPESMFVKDTVEEDLMYTLEMMNVPESEKKAEIERVIKLCGLENFKSRHPYDLSGGEEQLAALSKILLSRPKVLLLDEPTKGLDICWKKKLGVILKKLKDSGTAIVIVSHDIEFCSECADRCVLLFNGIAAAEGEPRKFFSGNNFYTTCADRICRGIIDGVVLSSDLFDVFGCKKEEQDNDDVNISPLDSFDDGKVKKPIKKKNILFCLFFAVLFLVMIAAGNFVENPYALSLIQIFQIVFAGGALFSIAPSDKNSKNSYLRKKKIKNNTQIISFIVTAFIIFITAFVGNSLFDGRKYYIIGIIIIFELLFAFFVTLEKARFKARDIVAISAICAIAVASRTAFYMLPQFKPVAAIVIISAIAFGWQEGVLIGAVAGFVSNFFFGQGPWTPWQMLAFSLIGGIFGVISAWGNVLKSRLVLCILGGASVLFIYGGCMNLYSALIAQESPSIGSVVSVFLLSLPFDLVHALSTAFFLWFGADAAIKIFDRLKIKYGVLCE